MLAGTIQDILDMYRDHDIAAEFRRRELRRREGQEQSPAPGTLESDSGWFDAPRSRSAELVDSAPSTSAGAQLCLMNYLELGRDLFLMFLRSRGCSRVVRPEIFHSQVVCLLAAQPVTNAILALDQDVG